MRLTTARHGQTRSAQSARPGATSTTDATPAMSDVGEACGNAAEQRSAPHNPYIPVYDVDP